MKKKKKFPLHSLLIQSREQQETRLGEREKFRQRTIVLLFSIRTRVSTSSAKQHASEAITNVVYRSYTTWKLEFRAAYKFSIHGAQPRNNRVQLYDRAKLFRVSYRIIGGRGGGNSIPLTNKWR